MIYFLSDNFFVLCEFSEFSLLYFFCRYQDVAKNLLHFTVNPCFKLQNHFFTSFLIIFTAFFFSSSPRLFFSSNNLRSSRNETRHDDENINNRIKFNSFTRNSKFSQIIPHGIVEWNFVSNNLDNI
jgi:hypothetical protein